MDQYLETLFQQHQRYKDTRPHFIPPELPKMGETWTSPGQKRGIRKNRMVTAFGETLPLYLMTKKHGITRQLLQQRLNAGKTPEEALTTPLGIGRPRRKQ